jgi:hypothetical protein
MKKILGLMIMLLVVAIAPSYSQANLNGSNEKVVIDKADLTPAQIASYEAQAQIEKANAEIAKLERKLETYGKWVGVGGEIGQAVKDGLTSVVDVADKFGSTNVGRFTMIMIAWKVMGKEVVQIILGLLFFFTFLITLILIFRRIVLPRRIKIENPGFFKYPKTYKIVTTELDSEGVTIVTVVFVIAFLLSIWITYAIMF